MNLSTEWRCFVTRAYPHVMGREAVGQRDTAAKNELKNGDHKTATTNGDYPHRRYVGQRVRQHQEDRCPYTSRNKPPGGIEPPFFPYEGDSSHLPSSLHLPP